jgi:hypothetical protein
MLSAMATKQLQVSVGDQVYVGKVEEEIGSVRLVESDHLFVYIENGGEFRVDRDAVLSIHDGKVILDPSKIEPRLEKAIASAHVRETE